MSGKTCKERIRGEYKDRISDIRKLWKAYCAGKEGVKDLGSFHEYGLSFDYVPEGTFGDQKVAYFRYQLSWGGPSDEFRFFVNPDFRVYRIEYWFLNWYDGAHVVLDGEDERLLEEIFDGFRDIGSVDSAYEQWKEV